MRLIDLLKKFSHLNIEEHVKLIVYRPDLEKTGDEFKNIKSNAYNFIQYADNEVVEFGLGEDCIEVIIHE